MIESSCGKKRGEHAITIGVLFIDGIKRLVRSVYLLGAHRMRACYLLNVI